MSRIGVRYPENATLPGGLNHTCHFKSQFFKISYDEAIIAEWSIGEMGYLALPIWNAIPATKSCERIGSADFLAKHPDSRTTKLYEDLPDEIAKVCMTQTSFEEQVWQLFFDGESRTGPRGNIIAGVGVVLVSPQNYVIPYAFSLTEMCSNNVVEYNNILIECKSPMRLVLKISKRMVIQSSSSIRYAGSAKSVTWRLCALSQRNPLHGREIQKLLHWPCTSPAKYACRCTGIPRRFLGPSSQSNRESTHLQPWLVLSKIHPWRWSNSNRRPSSQRSSGDFSRSRDQGLAILIHRLRRLRYTTRWPQRGDRY